MTLVYLIRHAQNEYIVEKKLPGWLPGIHLNDSGVAQANAVANALAKIRIAAVYSSPLERAIETAEPIADVKGLDVIPRPGLGEVRCGRWQGKSLKTLRRYKLWKIIQHTPSLAKFPEGESFTEAQSRIVAEIESLRMKHSKPKETIICVSHSDTIKLAIAHYLGLPLDMFQRLTIEPASISILSVGKSYIRLVRLNATPTSI
jgi:probable phosphomutase (TIGR03848 family)